jgi:hypothetical protein
MHVNERQHELFKELPQSKDPRAVLAEFRVGEKIIAVPLSFWKDGRARYDFTSLGGDFVMSRNLSKAEKLAEDELREIFQTAEVRAIEAVRRHFHEVERGARIKRPPIRKKDLIQPKQCIYANPLIEDRTVLFGKYPDWLLARRDLGAHEKLVYGRLLFPLPPICDHFERTEGVIFGLDQTEVGKAVGMSRQTANKWLIKLQLKRWIICFGNSGAKQVTRFLWREGMPSTCRTAEQVDEKQGAPRSGASCDSIEQQPAMHSGATCHTAQQDPQVLETREREREAEKKPSRPWCNF